MSNVTMPPGGMGGMIYSNILGTPPSQGVMNGQIFISGPLYPRFVYPLGNVSVRYVIPVLLSVPMFWTVNKNVTLPLQAGPTISLFTVISVRQSSMTKFSRSWARLL